MKSHTLLPILLTVFCLTACNAKKDENKNRENTELPPRAIALSETSKNGSPTIYELSKAEDNLDKDIAIGAISDPDLKESLLGKHDLNQKWLCIQLVSIPNKMDKAVPYTEIETTSEYGKDIFEKDVTIMKGKDGYKNNYLYSIAFKGDYKTTDFEAYQIKYNEDEAKINKVVSNIRKALDEGSYPQPLGFNNNILNLKSLITFENMDKDIEVAVFETDDASINDQNLSNKLVFVLENGLIKYSVQGITYKVYAYKLKEKRMLHLESSVFSANLYAILDIDKNSEKPMFYLTRFTN